jgi:dihydroflavonol-4-reductase
MSEAGNTDGEWSSRGTVLVTGATGFTGSHLARTLLRRGARVRVLVRDAGAARGLSEAGADVVQGDLKSRGDLERAVAGTSTIFHAAALYREARHPDSEYVAVNADAPCHVVELAALYGVSRVVHCSTIGVHGDVGDAVANEDSPFAPSDIYQATKLAGELAARETAQRLGVALATVRPAAIYGPGDRRFLKLFAGVARRRFPMIGRGEVMLHPVYIDDLVDGMLLAATRDEAVGRTYILGGRDALSLNEIVRTIAELATVAPPRLHLPVWPFLAAGWICETACRPLGWEPPLHRRRVAFFTKNRIFDISRARNEIGYEPRFCWRDGAARTLDWYRESGWI